MHEAAKKYILRYANLADEHAQKETDEKRKAELLEMAEICRQLAGERP